MTFDNIIDLAVSCDHKCFTESSDGCREPFETSDDDLDSLTGFWHLSYFEKNCDKYLRECGKHGFHALFFLTLDHLKQARETLGPKRTDDSLKTTAKLLRCMFRGNDIIGRTGDDEFMVLMKDVPDLHIVETRAEELCRAIRQVFLDFEFPPGSCSIGVAFGNLGQLGFIESRNDADLALYEAKAQGKGRWSICVTGASSEG